MRRAYPPAFLYAFHIRQCEPHEFANLRWIANSKGGAIKGITIEEESFVVYAAVGNYLLQDLANHPLVSRSIRVKGL